jgi:hypothetical protein
VFGIPTALLKGRTGAPLGDAILAGVGVDVFDDFSVAKDWAEYASTWSRTAATTRCTWSTSTSTRASTRM